MASVKRLKAMADLLAKTRRGTDGLTAAADSSLWDKSPYWERSAPGGDRSPMVVTSSHWLYQNKYIILYVNPSEMAWSMPRRETVTKTAAGAIRNAWRNRYRGTYYDEPTVTITFQTGNMMPGAGIPDSIFGNRRVTYSTSATSGQKVPTVTRDGGYADRVAQILQTPPVPPGIVNFYDFLSLVDEPMLSSNNNENRHILLVRTRLFPRLRLEGYFTQDPITFTESATAANSITWNATFMVYDSTPRFWKTEALKIAFSDAIRSYGAMSEIIPKDFDLEEFQKYWQDSTGKDLNDTALPYQTTKLDSQTGRKKKEVGLVGAPAGKTGTPKRSLAEGEVAGVQPGVNPVEATTQQNLAATDKIIGDYKGAGAQPGTYSDETLKQTEYWPALQAAINREFTELWDSSKGPPPVNDINAYAAEWMKANMAPEDLARYDVLRHRLENP